MHANEQTKDHVSPLILWGHWFTFINMLIAMLISTRYLFSHGWPDTLVAQAYAVINLIGHSAFLGFACYLFAIFPITLLLPFSHFLRGFSAVVATIGLTALTFDADIFAHYRLHLNPFVFDVASSDVTALLESPLLVVVPVALLALQLVLANGLWKRLARIRRKRLGSKVVVFLAGCFVSAHLIHIWADATGYVPITSQDDIFPLHYPATARGFIAKQGLLEEEVIEQMNLQAEATNQITYPLVPMQCQAEPQQNIMLVVINGWRAEMVNATTMPYLTELAQTSHWFTHHSAASNQAAHGLYTMLYGMLPNYREPLTLDQKEPVITAATKRLGYNNNAFGLEEAYNKFGGHTWLKGFTIHPTPTDDVAAEQDIAITEQVIQHLNHTNKPQFNLVSLSAPAFYSTPVGDVGLPTVRSNKSLNHAQQVLFNQYRQSLRFLDNQLQRLVKAADPSTTIVITGTNGHLFTTDLEADSRANFSDEATDVPLLIRWEGQPAREIGYRTSHYDLVPTLMTLALSCETPSHSYSLGSDLYQPTQQDYLVMGNDRQFAVKTDTRITVIDNRGKYRVYDNDYRRLRNAKLDVPTLVKMMEEGQRFHPK